MYSDTYDKEDIDIDDFYKTKKYHDLYVYNRICRTSDEKTKVNFAVDCHTKYTRIPSELDLEKMYQHKEFEQWYEQFVKDFTRYASGDVCKKKGWVMFILDGDCENLECARSEASNKYMASMIWSLQNFGIYAGEVVRRFNEAGYKTRIDYVDDVHFVVRAVIVEKPLMKELRYYDE
jgi:hypothetical protein